MEDQSRNALLQVLLVCIGSYRKSALRYKFVILGTYHPGSLYLDVRIRGYFAKLQRVREQLCLRNTILCFPDDYRK